MTESLDLSEMVLITFKFVLGVKKKRLYLNLKLHIESCDLTSFNILQDINKLVTCKVGRTEKNECKIVFR